MTGNATVFSNMCQDIMKFLMDSDICFADREFEMYFTPLQCHMALGYSSGGIRNALLRLEKSKYVVSHTDFSMYKTDIEKTRKYLEDFKKA